MKKEYQSFLRKFVKISIIFMLLVSIFFMGFYSHSVLATSSSDKNFQWQNQDLVNETPLPASSVNKRPEQTLSGNFSSSESFDYTMEKGEYYGTYSFENEVGNYNMSISWVDHVLSTDTDSNAVIISEFDGHNSVIDMTSGGDNGKSFRIYHDQGQAFSFTVEYWFQYIDKGVGDHWFYVRGSGYELMDVVASSSTNRMTWYYGDGIGGVASSYVSCSPSIWHHVKILLDRTSDIYSFWMDGILLANGVNFRGDVDIYSFDYTYFYMTNFGGTNDGEWYIDAIGYSYDITSHDGKGYSIGYNVNAYDLTNLMNNWTLFTDTYGYNISIVNLDGHANSLRLHRNDFVGTTYTSVINYFDGSNHVNPTIEFWVNLNGTNAYGSNLRFNMYEDSSLYLDIWFDYMAAGRISNHITSGYATITTVNLLQWYHIKLVLDDTNEEYTFYIDGVSAGTFPYYAQGGYGGCNGMTRVGFGIDFTAFTDYYIDAIGYSWDSNYDVGDNFYPILISNSINYNINSINLLNGVIFYGNNNSLEFKDGENLEGGNDEPFGDLTLRMYFNSSDFPFNIAYLTLYIEYNNTDIATVIKEGTTASTSTGPIIISNPSNTGSLTLEIQDISQPVIYMNFFDGSASGYMIGVSIDYIIAFNIPITGILNSSQIGKYEFATDNTGELITNINNIVDWNVEGTYLSLYSQGYDNIIKFAPPPYFDPESYQQNNITLDMSSFTDENYVQYTATMYAVNDEDIYGSEEFNFYGSDNSIKLSVCFKYYSLGIVGVDGYFPFIALLVSTTSNDYDFYPNSYTQLHEWFCGNQQYTGPDSQGWNYMNDTFSLEIYKNYIQLNYSGLSWNFVGGSEDFSKTEVKFMAYNMEHLYLDSVGIYVDGNSISNEVAYSNVHYYVLPTWDITRYNFVELTLNNEYSNNISLHLNNGYQLFNFSDCYGKNQVFTNVYAISEQYNPDIIYETPYIQIYNSSEYEIINLHIFGISLIENDNVYFPELLYSGIDLNKSYFYVQNSQLHYQLTADDSNIEYIRIRFNLGADLFDTHGYYFRMTQYHSNENFISQLDLDYIQGLGETVSFVSTTQVETHSVILEQDKTIWRVDILITDNDELSSGQDYGYFSNLYFSYYPNIDTTITVSTLLGIIPLLILLVGIPIAIYFAFGKKSEIIIPALLLMTIFTMAIQLLPAWGGFVIIISCIGYWIVRGKNK